MNPSIVELANRFPQGETVQDYGKTLTIRLRQGLNGYKMSLNCDALKDFWKLDPELSISFNSNTQEVVICDGSISR